MNTELEIRKRIQQHQIKLADLIKHLKYINRLLEVSKWLTFGLYLAFAISIYLADIMHLRSFIEGATGSVIGFGFYLLICFVLAYVLAGIKHAAYSHMALFGRVVIIVCIVVSMGLMAEVFQSSGNQDMKSRVIAENSAEFKALINDKPVITQDTGISILIAAQRQKVARCEEKLKAGTEKHCEGDKAKLNSLVTSQQEATQAQVTIATANTKLAYSRMDKIKQEAYNPTIRAIASAFSIALASAIVWVMFFISAQFEALHYWLSEMKARTIAAIDGMQEALNRLEVEYFNLTGAEFSGTGEAIQPPPPVKQSFGFNQPAVAQQAPLFKYQQAQKQSAGFVNTDTLPKQTKPVSAKLGTAETQLDIPELSAPLPPAPDNKVSTWNRELSGHGIDSPTDPALNQEADKGAIQRVINKGLSTGKPPVHSTSDNVRVHKAGNVRVHPESTGKPTMSGNVRSQSDEAALLAALKDAKGKIDVDTLRDAFGLYKQWAADVTSKKPVLSARGGKQFINRHLCQARKKTITPGGMDALLTVWRKRAHREGLLKANPKYTGKPPHPEYLIA